MHNPISWHIEPTSRCTLECPGCDRTWFKNTFKFQPIQDINIDYLVNFFAENNFLKSTINLCGNNGDAIYHPQFIHLLEKLKSQQHTIHLNTNGSAKTEKFWQEVCDILDSDDTVIFAIDGLEDTNHLYRKNSNWQQVMTAVQTVTNSHVKSVWKFIVFKHNQHQIDEAKLLSKQLKMNKFLLKKSFRWMDESHEDFMPDQKYIDETYFSQKQIIEGQKTQGEMMPYCKSNQDIFIDSQGDIYPCCESATHRFKKKHVFGKQNINISQGKLILSQSHKNFLKSTHEWDTAPLVCRLHCSK